MPRVVVCVPQAIASYVQLFVAQHQAEEGDRITVKTAANLVRTMVYNNKDTMEAGIIVAGWDRVGGGQVCCGCGGDVHGHGWRQQGRRWCGSGTVKRIADGPVIVVGRAELAVLLSITASVVTYGYSGPVARSCAGVRHRPWRYHAPDALRHVRVGLGLHPRLVRQAVEGRHDGAGAAAPRSGLADRPMLGRGWLTSLPSCVLPRGRPAAAHTGSRAAWSHLQFRMSATLGWSPLRLA